MTNRHIIIVISAGSFRLPCSTVTSKLVEKFFTKRKLNVIKEGIYSISCKELKIPSALSELFKRIEQTWTSNSWIPQKILSRERSQFMQIRK